MIRTQIYLTNHQRDQLMALAGVAGRSQSDIIREAIDIFIQRNRSEGRDAVLREAAGIWRDRTDLPDFREARKSWDRYSA